MSTSSPLRSRPSMRASERAARNASQAEDGTGRRGSDRAIVHQGGRRLPRWLNGPASPMFAPEAAMAAAETMGCRSYRTSRSCSRKPAAMRSSSHAARHAPDIALFFIERGVPVLCEKPLAIDGASAVAICDAADRHGGDGHGIEVPVRRRRYPDKVADRLRHPRRHSAVRKCLHVENRYVEALELRSDHERRRRSDRQRHAFHRHSRYLLGPISEVLAIEGKRTQSPAVEDTVNLFLRTQSGTIATVDLSWNLNKELDTYVRIYGTNGTIFVGWRESKFRQASSPDWIVYGKGYDKVAAFRRQVDFCNRIIGTEPLLISNEDAVASVMVIKATRLAYRGRLGGGAGRRRGHAADARPRLARADRPRKINDGPHPSHGLDRGRASLSATARPWGHIAHSPPTIGRNCIIGEKSYIAYGVEIADSSRSTPSSTSATR